MMTHMPSSLARKSRRKFPGHVAAASLGVASHRAIGDWLQRCQAKTLSRRPLIYLVDDEPCILEMMETILKSQGYNVQAFPDRPPVLTQLRVEQPALLITDCRGGSITGLELIAQCRVIRPKLKILMASALREPPSPGHADSPDRFLEKPFTIPQLLDEVRSLLRRA
jgi:DNA-binding response OmpR family regulator